MNSSTRTPAKFRRHSDDRATQRSPRPAPRRRLTRAAIIAAAVKEG